MRKLVDKLLRKYGTAMVLEQASGDTTVYGFPQNTATAARKYVIPEYTPLGEVPQGQYLMLLPLEPMPAKGEVLAQGDKRYEVRRVERVWYRDEAIYCWCLCQEEGGADQWGNRL